MKSFRTALAAALGAVCLLCIPALASAAIWQGPVPISDASLQAHDTPDIALGAAGDAAAGWWDSGDGGRVVLARKRSGSGWSAPVKVGTGPDSVRVYVGVDGAGDVTATWSTGNGGPMAPSVTSIATWLASSATPTVEVLNTALLDIPEPVYVNDIAVSANGQAVLAGTAGDYDEVLGYRASASGAWAYNQKFGVQGSQPLLDPHVAINDSGDAVASYHTSSTIYASRRNAFADWGPVETVLGLGSTESHSVAIDAAGNTYVAFAAGTGGIVSAGAAFKPVGGAWAVSYPLSPNTTSFAASQVKVAISKAGAAYLTWTQVGPAPSDAAINGRAGVNGTWGPIENVSQMGADIAQTVVGGDGTVMTVWQHDTGADPRTGFARMRSPAGVWGDVHSLGAAYSGYANPDGATDGSGHYAVVAAPLIGTTKQVQVSFFDTVAPVIPSAALTGAAEAGSPLSFSVAPTDQWSAIPTINWTFGDGGTGAGATVSHTYANAGTYTAGVTAVDAAGNSTSSQVAVTIVAQQAVLTSASLSGTWKQSRVKGTLTVKGSVPRAGAYAVDALLGKAQKLHASLTLPAGEFSKTVALPATLVPGSYTVSLLPGFPATQVKPASRPAVLVAPATGVVDQTVLSGAKNGPPASTLRNVNTIWATFHFAAVPKGKLTVTWYLTPKGGKRQNLGSTAKSASANIVSFIRLGGRRGKVTASISRKGVLIAQRSITTK